MSFPPGASVFSRKAVLRRDAQSCAGTGLKKISLTSTVARHAWAPFTLATNGETGFRHFVRKNLVLDVQATVSTTLAFLQPQWRFWAPGTFGPCIASLC